MSQETRPYVGGQAVIEGVFMRAPRAVAVAVRTRQGIQKKVERYEPFFQRYAFFRAPFMRGAFLMLESLYVGMKALSWSAEQAAADEESAEPAPAQPPKPRSETREKALLTGTMALSMVAGLALFVALPHYVTDGISWLTGVPLPVEGAAFHLIDGVVKLAVFLTYLALIRRSEEIRRVFAYHGAEHKTIYAWEQKLDLTVEQVRLQPRFHPRCGTSFLIGVVCISILVFAAIFPLLPAVPVENRLLKNLVQVAIKVPLTVPIAALSYELLRFSARHYGNVFCRALASPGLLLQRLTTEEPDDAQIQVAIEALSAALEEDARAGAPVLGLEGPVFPTGPAPVTG